MPFSLPYILFIITLGVLAYITHRYKEDESICRLVNVSGIVLFVIFIGLRGFAMFDWYNYYPEFQKMSFSDFSGHELGFDRELGWMTFVLSCKSIYDNYHFMVFVHTLLTATLFFRFLKKNTSNMLLGAVLCFAFDGFALFFNLMRNSISLLIFLNALPYLRDRKPLPYFSLCLLAFTFHYSSVFFFPLYFFLHIRLNKYIFLGYLVFCATFFLAHLSIFATLAEALFGNSEIVTKMVKAYTKMSSENGISLVFLERFTTGILFFCYYDRLHEIRPESSLYLNAFLLYITCTFLFSDLSEISARLSLLFIFSYWILYGDLIKCFAIDNNRYLFVTFVSLYCLYRTHMPMWNAVYQYDNLLFGIKSYNERCVIFDHTNTEKK